MLKEMSYLDAIAWLAKNESAEDRETLEQTGTVGLISLVFSIPASTVADDVVRSREQYPRITFGDETTAKLGNEIVRLFDVIRKKDEELVARMKEITSYRNLQGEASKRIESLHREVTTAKERILALEGLLAGKDARIEQINREFTACGRDLGKQVRELQRERTDLELLARNRLHEIEKLKETEKTLEADLVYADKVNADLAAKLREAEQKGEKS